MDEETRAQKFSRREKRKRSSFIKMVSFLILLLIIISIGISFLTDAKEEAETGDEQPNEGQDGQPTDNHNQDDQDASDGEETKPSELVEEIVHLSKQGKIEVSSFIAGKTTENEVIKSWGDPQHTSEVNEQIFEEFPEYDATIGFKNRLIVDLRSMGTDLQKIHYDDILQKLGEADDVNYFKDENISQIILSYQVNQRYRLRWILPEPTEDAPNPNVDHTSVVYSMQQPVEEGDNQSVSDILADMSLEEKISQMVIAGIEGTSLESNDKKLIDNQVGGVIFYGNNIQTSDQTKRLVESIKERNKSNTLPLFISIDQEGGRISRLPGIEVTPSNQEIGETGDESFAYSVGQTLGEQLQAFGFNMNYAPVLDIDSNPNNPVIGDRSFGNQAELVSKLGIQTMKGIQSKKIISVVKHFPGHGDTSIDSHVELPKVTKSMDALKDLELIPFKDAIENGADVVMVAHILLPKLDETFPASMSKKIIKNLLREELGYQGVVVTDDMTMGAVVKHFGIGEAAVDTVLAGSDIILVAHDYNNVVEVMNAIKKAVETGKITEEQINESVTRIIELKKMYLIN